MDKQIIYSLYLYYWRLGFTASTCTSDEQLEKQVEDYKKNNPILSEEEFFKSDKYVEHYTGKVCYLNI